MATSKRRLKENAPGSLYKDRYLFTGDHLYQNPTRDFPTAFVRRCWYNWGEQIRSMERLSRYRFEWILPGHGGFVHYPEKLMSEKMRSCVEWMKTVS